MEARAILRNVRIAPRKVKVVCDLIRGKSAAEANAIMMNTPKAASEILVKLLKSAVANAENNHNMDTSRLYVSEAFVGAGVTLKRIRPKDHGRAHRILKRTSNITLVVKEAE